MIQKEFIPYELALELKQLGFDEPCFCFYQVEYHEKSPIMVDDDNQYLISGFRTCKNSEIPNHYTAAPTYSQAFRWFREKGIVNEIHSDFDKMLGYNRGYIPVVQFIEFCNNGDCYETYEEAELACLKKLIEIVKLNN